MAEGPKLKEGTRRYIVVIVDFGQSVDEPRGFPVVAKFDVVWYTPLGALKEAFRRFEEEFEFDEEYAEKHYGARIELAPGELGLKKGVVGLGYADYRRDAFASCQEGKQRRAGPPKCSECGHYHIQEVDCYGAYLERGGERRSYDNRWPGEF